MQNYTYPTAFWRAILVCALISLVVAAVAYGAFGLELGSAEEGPLETLQEWMLVGACVFLLAAAREQAEGAPRLASIAGAVLAAVFLLRELEPVGDGTLAHYVRSESFRLHEALAILAIALFMIRPLVRYAGECLSWLIQGSAWPLFAAGAVLLISDAIDGHHSVMGVTWLPRMIEETMETFAYAIILAVAIRWYRIACGLFPRP